MIRRFQFVRNDVPVSILYGEKSWLRKLTEEVLREKRPDSYINIEVNYDLFLFPIYFAFSISYED